VAVARRLVRLLAFVPFLATLTNAHHIRDLFAQCRAGTFDSPIGSGNICTQYYSNSRDIFCNPHISLLKNNSMAEAAPDRSLREVYNEARTKKDQLDDLDPRSGTFKDTLSNILTDLETCHRLIQDLAIFSPNEDLEDLSTQSLQYLTVDYLIAELLQRSYDANRLAALKRISVLLDEFLTRLDQYSMLSVDDRKLFERYQEEKGKFALLPANPEDRRRLKIKRFQEEKDLKKKLEVGDPVDNKSTLTMSSSICVHNHKRTTSMTRPFGSCT
jgi:hypothetical protein